MIGKTLGTYEIIEPLGAGGMGEVYRAQDAKLGREVAIKVLPVDLSQDPDRLARLEREARLLASLNHPNIATIFSLDEVDGTSFLVLELIEGESLEQRLVRGPLPIEEALDICGQVARALEVAHQADIVHRDLKPANVLVTPDDRAKVLDFGIAKTLTPVEEDGATADATQLTKDGTMVGTVPYMSPEQVRGQAVDKRSDVWAFGCLLFETLSGTGPFLRETVADTLAAIVGEEPQWELLPAEVSPSVRLLLHRCLQKSPKVRQRDIGDAWVELNQSLSHPGGVPMSLPPTMAGEAPVLRRGIAAISVIGALALGTLAGWWIAPDAPVPGMPQYFEIDVPESAAFPGNSGSNVAISPDGNKVVLRMEGAEGESSRQLFVRRLDQPAPLQPVPGSLGAQYPFFSPDGDTVAFNTPEGTIESYSLTGGDRQTLCRRCTDGAWGDDGSLIVLGRQGNSFGWWGYRAQAEADGTPERLPRPRIDDVVLGPKRVDVLPGSRAVLFEDDGTAAIYAFDLDTEEVVEVAQNASDPYYAGGYVFFPRDFTLYAVPFDVDTLRPTGQPFAAAGGVRTEGGLALHAAVSRDNGVLAFVPAPTVGKRLGWVGREGEWDDIYEGEYSDLWFDPRVSPDGNRIAFVVGSERAPGIYVVDDVTGSMEMFIENKPEFGLMAFPVWSRDGSSISALVGRRTQDGQRGAIARKAGDSSSSVEFLLEAPFAQSRSWVPSAWTPGDRALIYALRDQSPRLLSVAPGAAERDAPIFDDDFDARDLALSHDGRWLSYTSERLDSNIVYVRALAGGDEIRVSPGGGVQPRWAPDDSELFYIDGDRLMSARLRVAEGVLEVESVEGLFDMTDYPAPRRGLGRYDVHPDGNRFAVIRPNEVDDARFVRVVTNWFEHMRQLAREQQEAER